VQIAKNFEAGGVPKHKIVMGYEPVGNGKLGGRPYDNSQAGGGIWEGAEVDIAAATALADGCYGGAMFWALNAPEALKTPTGEDVLLPVVEAIAGVHDARRASCATTEEVEPTCNDHTKKRMCDKAEGCVWAKSAGVCVAEEEESSSSSSEEDEVCGTPGKLVKPRNQTGKSKVASACACEEACAATPNSASWRYNKPKSVCQCFAQHKKLKKAKREGKIWAGELKA